jgi:uncharacterized BrkB/YihY/UPF0761 family membrane protein
VPVHHRIYGVERERPTLHKYARALLLTVVAGLSALVSFLLLVAGGTIGASMQRWYHWSAAGVTTWNVLQWPANLGLSVVTMSVLFRYEPRRHQPGRGLRAAGPDQWEPLEGRTGATSHT